MNARAEWAMITSLYNPDYIKALKKVTALTLSNPNLTLFLTLTSRPNSSNPYIPLTQTVARTAFRQPVQGLVTLIYP